MTFKKATGATVSVAATVSTTDYILVDQNGEVKQVAIQTFGNTLGFFTQASASAEINAITSSLISGQVSAQVSNQVSSQIASYNLSAMVSTQVSAQMSAQVSAMVSNQVSAQVSNQVSVQIAAGNYMTSAAASALISAMISAQASAQIAALTSQQISVMISAQASAQIAAITSNMISAQVSNQVSSQLAGISPREFSMHHNLYFTSAQSATQWGNLVLFSDRTQTLKSITGYGFGSQTQSVWGFEKLLANDIFASVIINNNDLTVVSVSARVTAGSSDCIVMYNTSNLPAGVFNISFIYRISVV
jgi:hypothetical protein